jgi:hypothetical protein
MLVAPDIGFAVIFRATVLSDASNQITRGGVGKQITRNLDVPMDEHLPTAPIPAAAIRPGHVSFCLLQNCFRGRPESRIAPISRRTAAPPSENGAWQWASERAGVAVRDDQVRRRFHRRCAKTATRPGPRGYPVAVLRMAAK